jgi:CMP-N-acetylneuraminic acid synthetase
MEKIVALLPIKANSERVKSKNTRSFNGQPLFTIMLTRLNECDYIENILINTDCDKVKEYITKNPSKAIIIDRPCELRDDLITMNTLIAHDIQFTKNEHFLQMHCTNPLLTLSTINNSIEKYFSSLPDYDSLFTVNRIQCRTYDHNGAPINHNFSRMERTQDMKPVYSENSNIFLFSRSSFENAGNNRIGKKPQLFEMDTIEATDIDYEEDFILAELIDRNKNLFPDIFQL